MDSPREITVASTGPLVHAAPPSAGLEPPEAETLRALLSAIRFRDDSPFRPHLGLLLWTIQQLRPRAVVQIGLGDLMPLFAACQALEEQGIPAQTLGIAPPGTALGPRALDHAEAFHPGLALQSGDPIALAAQQAPGSVDLLLLSPELRDPAALLEAWAPVLSPQAVVLAHGAASRLAASEPVALRPEGLGLALVLAGPEPEPRLAALATEGEAVLRDLAALSDAALAEGEAADPATAALLARLDAREAEVRDLEATLAARYRELAALEALLAGGFGARWRAQRTDVARPPRPSLRSRAVQAAREILDRSPPKVAEPLRRTARLARRLLRR